MIESVSSLPPNTFSWAVIRQSFRKNFRTYTMVVALAVIWLLFGFLTDWVFFDARNLSNLFRQMTIVSFLSIGMVLIITTGNIDLSVGSSTGLVSAIVAKLQVAIIPAILSTMMPSIGTGGVLNTILSIIAALAVGLLIGVVQGGLIAYLKIPSFIVTLGGMLIFRGCVLAVTEGKTLTVYEESFKDIAQGYVPNELGWVLGLGVVAAIVFLAQRTRRQRRTFGFTLAPLRRDIVRTGLLAVMVIGFVVLMNHYRGIPVPVLLMVAVAAVFAYITNNTKFGRYTYALGGNREATRLSGINIDRVVFNVFVLIGLMSGVSGVVLTGYVAAGTIGGGVNYELEAIAACVIGGTSLAGGEGTIAGALVGSLIMASLNNGMSVMNMDVFWQYIIRGLVLIAAVYVDVSSKRTRT